MKIEVIEFGGFVAAMEALRLPYSKPCRTDGVAYLDFHDEEKPFTLESATKVRFSPEDVELATKLVKADDCQAKIMRGIVVWLKITAPVYWWCEMETYRHGHERLCSESTMHVDCKGLQGAELQEAKANIPMGKELTKIDSFSYQCLRNIYTWRRHHRLPEWREFCKFIEEQMPLSKEWITVGHGEEK